MDKNVAILFARSQLGMFGRASYEPLNRGVALQTIFANPRKPKKPDDVQLPFGRLQNNPDSSMGGGLGIEKATGSAGSV